MSVGISGSSMTPSISRNRWPYLAIGWNEVTGSRAVGTKSRIDSNIPLQRSAVQLSCRSSVERVSLHGASRCPHNFPPTLLVS